MYQPAPRWIEEGDSACLMWGHVKVGEVTLGQSGWYAYYRENHRSERFTSLKDFPTSDLAKLEVDRALQKAAER